MKQQGKSAGGINFQGSKPQKLPKIGEAEKHIRTFSEKPKKRFVYPAGIDVPMLDPIIIPFGYSQSYSLEKNRWFLVPDNLR